MIGRFQDGTTPGKMHYGGGWWFLDQKDMERQLNALSNLGLLSRFVGMLTDSRSFLSYPARILPPHPVQPVGAEMEQVAAQRDGVDRFDGPRHLLWQRNRLLRVQPAGFGNPSARHPTLKTP